MDGVREGVKALIEGVNEEVDILDVRDSMLFLWVCGGGR